MIDHVPAETICPPEFSVAKSFSDLWTLPRLKVDKILENDCRMRSKQLSLGQES